MAKLVKLMRIPLELEQLKKNTPGHGISVTNVSGDYYTNLLATIPGPRGSPYELGKFSIAITVDDQYPFHPPTFKFLTPVFHPNIDYAGKICLDLLRMPPTGTYNPAITLESILLSLQLLLGSPNPDDPLQEDAANLYKRDRELFNATVRKFVRKHCLDTGEEASSINAGAVKSSVATNETEKDVEMKINEYSNKKLGLNTAKNS